VSVRTGKQFGARHELYEVNYAGERGALVAGIHHYLERFMRGV
jgi:hypothetical protein